MLFHNVIGYPGWRVLVGLMASVSGVRAAARGRARTAIELETPYSVREVAKLADAVYKPGDQSAHLLRLLPHQRHDHCAVQHDDAGRNPHRVRRRPHPPRRRRLPQRTTSPRARPPQTPLNQVHPENMLALHKWGPRSFRRRPLSTATQRYRKSSIISSAEYLISSDCRHLPCADGPQTTTTRLHSDTFIPIPRRQSAHQPIRRDGAADRPFPQHKHCDRNQCRSMHGQRAPAAPRVSLPSVLRKRLGR